MLARVVVMMAALFVASSIVPAVSAAARLPGTSATGVLESVGIGGVAINGSSTATANPIVSVTVPAPSNRFGALRLSNDGRSDLARTDLDHHRPLGHRRSCRGLRRRRRIEDGHRSREATASAVGSPIGSASILLDRTGPSLSVPWFSHADRVAHLRRTGCGRRRRRPGSNGRSRSTASTGGRSHRVPFSFYVGSVVDLREGTIGGSWTPGAHDVYTRAVDKLGNVTQSDSPAILTPTSMRMGDDPPADFEFPLPAVAGQPFTYSLPVFDPRYTVPAGQFCQWRLVWGSETVPPRGWL